MSEQFFIVRDSYPNGWELMQGNPETAVGISRATGRTIKGLMARVPEHCPVYRSYLQRTDGRTGMKLIRQSNEATTK